MPTQEDYVALATWFGNQVGADILTREINQVVRHGGEVFATTWRAVKTVAETNDLQPPAARYPHATPQVVLFCVPFELCAPTERVPRTKYEKVRQLAWAVFDKDLGAYDGLMEIKSLNPLPPHMIVWHGEPEDALIQIEPQLMSPGRQRQPRIRSLAAIRQGPDCPTLDGRSYCSTRADERYPHIQKVPPLPYFPKVRAILAGNPVSKLEDFRVLLGLIANVSANMGQELDPEIEDLFSDFVSWADKELEHRVSTIGGLSRYLDQNSQHLADRHGLQPEAVLALVDFADRFLEAFPPSAGERETLHQLDQRWFSHLPQQRVPMTPQPGPVIDIDYMVNQVWLNGQARYKQKHRPISGSLAWEATSPEWLYANYLAALDENARIAEWRDCIALLPATSVRDVFLDEPEFWERLEHLVVQHTAIDP